MQTVIDGKDVAIKGVRYADGRPMHDGAEILDIDPVNARVVVAVKNAAGVIVDRMTRNLKVTADGWVEI